MSSDEPVTGRLTALGGLPGEDVPTGDARRILEQKLFDARSMGARRRILAEMRRRGFDMAALGKQWAELDPAGYLEFASGVRWDDRDVLVAVRSAFENLASSDLARAEGLAMGYRDILGVQMAFGIVMDEALARSEPGDFARMMGKAVPYLGEKWVGAITVEDCAKVGAALARVPESGASLEMKMALMGRWLSSDPEAAEAWIRSLPAGEARDFGLDSLLTKAIEQDAAEGLELYAELREEFPEWKGGRGALLMMGEDLLGRDRVAGVEWARVNLREHERDRFYGGVTLDLLKEGDVQTAKELMRYYPPGNRWSAVEAIAAHIGREDPEVGIRWAIGLGHAEGRQAVDRMSSRWAFKNSQAARAMVEDPETPPFPELTQKLAETMAGSDPQAAIGWVQELPPERAGKAYPTAVIAWAKSDPEAAVDYVMTLPEGEMRYNLIRDAGNRLVRANVDEAAAWMSGLTSEADRKAARISISKSGVKGEARSRLLEALGGE